jgi:hypothetical protein
MWPRNWSRLGPLEATTVVNGMSSAGVPSAGILTPVISTEGGVGVGASSQPRNDRMAESIVEVGLTFVEEQGCNGPV